MTATSQTALTTRIQGVGVAGYKENTGPGISQLLHDMRDSTVATVNSVADLRTALTAGVAAATFHVRYHTTLGDGGGGRFNAEPIGAHVDNNGTIFTGGSLAALRDVSSSAWANVAWWGLAANPTSAITSAVAYCKANAMPLMFPAGSYSYSTTIDLDSTNGFTLAGAGNYGGGTSLTYTGTGHAVTAASSNGLVLRGLQLRGTTALTGCVLNLRGTYSVATTNVEVSNVTLVGNSNGTGILLDNAYGFSHTYDRLALANGAIGIRGPILWGEYTESITIKSISTYGETISGTIIVNPDRGWRLHGLLENMVGQGASAVKCLVPASGLKIDNCWFGDGQSGNYLLLAGDGLTVDGCTFEGTASILTISLPSVHRGVKISGNKLTGFTSSITMTGGGTNVDISGNSEKAGSITGSALSGAINGVAASGSDPSVDGVLLAALKSIFGTDLLEVHLLRDILHLDGYVWSWPDSIGDIHLLNKIEPFFTGNNTTGLHSGGADGKYLVNAGAPAKSLWIVCQPDSYPVNGYKYPALTSDLQFLTNGNDWATDYSTRYRDGVQTDAYSAGLHIYECSNANAVSNDLYVGGFPPAQEFPGYVRFVMKLASVPSGGNRTSAVTALKTRFSIA